MLRTHTCGELRKEHAEKEVTLCGWVGSLRVQGKVGFLLLRDRYGITQVFLEPGLCKEVRRESVVKIKGVVKVRPEKQIRKEMATGEVEVAATSMEVLNEAQPLPMELDESIATTEETRLAYRYLDLRRPRLQKNMMLRHKIIKFIRDYMDAHSFIELETPILTKSTPEGARDYVVPSRLYPGKFFALPQSPQQYKQLFMVAGFDKYFQIARCFRDEDSRGDRQPEFTQLDIEMSFVEQDDILSLIESLFTELVKKLLPDFHFTQTPWPRLKYEEVMKQYGTDKPDLRKNKDDPKELAFAFIVDFPMFKYNEEEGKWDSEHHPFTMIKKDHIKYLESKEFDKVHADAYDFILNGYELASGSIRINDPKFQKKIFDALGLSSEQIQEKFGHMIGAFSYGAPPHGGIAPGIDRFVMIIAGEPNIREVIAFPKTKDARDPMMKSPSSLDEAQLNDLGLKLKNG